MSDVGELTEAEQRAFQERPTLLAAAQRCNRYRASDYLPVYVEDVKVGRGMWECGGLRCVFVLLGWGGSVSYAALSTRPLKSLVSE